MESKYCVKCGKIFNKPIGVRGKRWRNRKYCSLACNINSIKGWNKGKAIELSPELKIKKAGIIRQNVANYWATTSEEQQQSRAEKISKGLTGKKKNIEVVLAVTGNKSKHWKGEEANYNSKHRWIQKRWTKTDICEDCGRKVLPRSGTRLHHATHWANISGKYLRDRKDWKELCPKCHRKFDSILSN